MIRAFPRRTNATPVDENVRIGFPHLWDHPDEVYISVTFTWDIPKSRLMEKEWKRVCDRVLIGGPALGTRGKEFEPGMFVKKGYVITSRGCPNKCWFCDVWKREGAIQELPIRLVGNMGDTNSARRLLEAQQLHQQPVRRFRLY